MEGGIGDSTSIIVNQALVEDWNWSDPLSERLYLGEQDKEGLRVIGVVRNFHFQSLEYEIEPLAMLGSSASGRYMTRLIVKLSSSNLPRALESAEDAWYAIYPSSSFDYQFADDEVAHQYANYERWIKITGIATIMAILIASLGIFGLSGINSESRIKEIGIRKVFGADFSSVFILLNRPFILMAIIAFLLAVPTFLVRYESMVSQLQVQYRNRMGNICIWNSFITNSCIAYSQLSCDKICKFKPGGDIKMGMIVIAR